MIPQIFHILQKLSISKKYRKNILIWVIFSKKSGNVRPIKHTNYTSDYRRNSTRNLFWSENVLLMLIFDLLPKIKDLRHFFYKMTYYRRHEDRKTFNGYPIMHPELWLYHKLLLCLSALCLITYYVIFSSNSRWRTSVHPLPGLLKILSITLIFTV